MSTKMTILSGKDFHFYEDLMGENWLFLELSNQWFEASRNEVTIAIPRGLWEAIRLRGGVDYKEADKTKKQIRAEIEIDVDNHIREYEAADKNSRGFMKIWGYDKPRDEQIAKQMKARLEYRNKLRQILRDAKKIVENGK